MRNIVITIFLIVQIAISSCAIQSNKIRGNGVITKESREIYSFNRVEIDGVVNVIFLQGTEEKVVVEADENLQPYIHVYTAGNKLIIDTDDDKNYKFTENNIYITFKDVEVINHNGVGSIINEGIVKCIDLALNNNGVGQINLHLECEKLSARQKGVGSLKLKGSSNFLDLENSGVGQVNSTEMIANYVDIRNTGVGSTNVYAEKEISITSTGVGSVKYKGDAVVKNINASGIGGVKKTD